MKKKSGIETRVNRAGAVFVLPFILVYAAFQFWPVIYTLMLGFSDIKGFKTDMGFVGLENFKRLVTDKFFWDSVYNTFCMWGLNFAPQLSIALIFAIWFTDLRLNLKCKGLFRAVFYMPNLLTTASIAILFRSLFAYPIGPVNQFLTGTLNIWATEIVDGEEVLRGFNFFRMNVTPDKDYLIDWVPRIIVAFIQWWMWCGHTLIMLMAGITSISPSLYEAAIVDGANQRQQTWLITIPLLRPMMLYLLVTSMIGGMQLFEIPFLLTDMRGGPRYAIRTMGVYLYNMGFQGKTDYSYAAAIAIGVFIITILLATMINQMIKDRKFNQWWYLLLMLIFIIVGFALYMWTRMFILLLAFGYVGVGVVALHHYLYEKRRTNR
ncbi:ABC transporter permease subunit [Treponema sp.]|uniref:carbohydrate ABC transporter permease n=1 Tax=Treponema sp. TaxID=166 RepID=UPI00388E918A